MTKALFLAIVVATAMQARPVTFTTIASGDHSQIETEQRSEARTAAEWAKVWQAHGGGETPPGVDFTKDMVVGIFAGTRPSAGYAVEVTRVQTDGATLRVEYRVCGPKPDAMVAQMLTSPFHIVRVPVHAKVTYVTAK